MKKTLTFAILLVAVGVMQSRATQLVRELWDKVAPVSGIPLKGLTNGTTSYGFYPSTVTSWTINPAALAATNALLVDTNNDVMDWLLGVAGAYLPASATVPGTLSLANNNTNGANGGWDSGFWAVRRLATTSAINFSANGTYYFSARLLKRGTWWMNDGTNNYGNDDAALGFGLANGSTASSRFVGAGFTRSQAGNLSNGGGYLTSDGLTDIGDSVYITTGTLGQAGYANHAADSGGPYYVRAYGTPQEVTGFIGSSPYVNGGLLVGRLTTTTSGSSELNVRAYVAGDSIDTDPGLVSWDATYTFTETVNMNYLLVWMHGNNRANPCWLDGIRVATTWAEALGEEIVGPPVASPTNTVYPGTPVTFSVVANADAANAWYQWMTNGVPDTNAIGAGTNYATYTLSPGTNNSGTTFSVVFSNSWGLAITSSVATLTVLPPIPPIITSFPQSGSRYAGAPSFTFSVVADGARPFTYHWKQIVGGTTNVLTDQTNATLTFTGIQPGSAGTFFVTVANAYGPSDSPSATLSVIVPTGYAAAIVTNGPYAYWQMNETNGTVLHDYWGGQNGAVLDPAYTITNIVATNNGTEITYTTNIIGAGVSLGVAGAACPGFPGNHYAVFIPNNSYLARVNMPALPVYASVMTFCGWIYTPGAPNATGFIWNRDLNSNGGYANAFGLNFTGYLTGGTTNYNQLGYQWGGGIENPTAPWNGHTWTNSGLYVPQANWTFVALVLSNAQATMYMGTNNGPLTVANSTLPEALDATFPGTIYTNNFPLLMGRGGYPWAESQSSAWNGVSMRMSDVAVFYSALPPTNVYQIYLAAVGELITTTNSNGSLVLSWPVGTLQAAGEVLGAYTNVSGATSPYTVPNNSPQKFYRVKI